MRNFLCKSSFLNCTREYNYYKTSYWSWRLKQVGQRVLWNHKDSRWNYKILVLIILIFKKATTLIHTMTPNCFREIWLYVCSQYARKEKFNRSIFFPSTNINIFYVPWKTSLLWSQQYSTKGIIYESIIYDKIKKWLRVTNM